MTEQRPDPARPVGLLGQGLLRDAVAAALGHRARLVADTGSGGRAGEQQGGVDDCALLVAATDAWDHDSHRNARALAADSLPWLPVRTELGKVVIGPLNEPGRAGCVDCAENRRRWVRPDRVAYEAVRQRYHPELAGRPSSWLTGLSAHLTATLVADELRRYVAGQPRTRGGLLTVDLGSLAVSGHRFLPDPLCGTCGSLPEDSAALARVELACQPAHQPGSYRGAAGDLDRLTDLYVDREAGLIHSVSTWSDHGLMVAAAPIRFRTGAGDAGYGRSASMRASQLTALLEALERYGCAPGGRRTLVDATYRAVADEALDPRSLGLHPPEQYELPHFRLRPYSPDQVYRWVWGWSFGRQRPILVPEQCAYYGVGHQDRSESRFVYEISNGCALGSSLAEAVLYGVLEVAERDAFLLTWYARLAAPKIELSSVDDRSVPLMAAAISGETGYQVMAFDITVEHGIPCVWAMARNPAHDARPALACAAGSHPDPVRAVRNALAELGPAISSLIRRYPGESGRARRMVEDSDLVTSMEDHSLLYAEPEAAARLDFLTGARTTRTIAEIGRADQGGFASDDLKDNALEAIGRYTARGMDVVLVDQTAPEHLAGGLRCVKVLIPGTLSMTFGHQYRRVHGLPRLYEVPHLLGYQARPLREDEINPYPHPFP